MSDQDFMNAVTSALDEAKKRMSQDLMDAWLEGIGEKQRREECDERKHPERTPVCECGSESAGSYRHSTWCPKFEK